MKRSAIRTMTTLAIGMVLLTACNTDEPEETPTSTPPTTFDVPTSTPDPTEEAEAAALEAVERYRTAVEQAGTSGEWSEDNLSTGARGEALGALLDAGSVYEASGWIFQGELVIADPEITALSVDPPEATVTFCYDQTTWRPTDQPAGGRATQVTAELQADTDGRMYVMSISGDEPCST